MRRGKPITKLILTLGLALAGLPLYGQLQVVLFEDFESTTAGNTVDALTGTLGGTWGAYVQDGSGPSFVQDEAATGIAPAAGGGTNYMDVADPNRDAFLDFDPFIITQLVDGTPIKLEYDIQRVGGSWGHLFIEDDSGGGTSQGEFQYELVYWPDNDNLIYRALPYSDGGIRTASGLSLPAGTWLHVSFEHTLGSNEAIITLGTNAVTVTDSTSMSHVWTTGECPGCGNGNIGQLKWTISTGGRTLIDNLSFSIPAEEALEIASFEVGPQDTLSFPSELGLEYQLEYSVLPATDIWQRAGFSVTGDGGTMFAFDPSEPGGSSTTKVYRAAAGAPSP